jgi:thiazole synthase
MLVLGDLKLKSRLMVGSGRYSDFETMAAVHNAAATQMVTLAVRRIDLDGASVENILDHIDRSRVHLLPNTAGCYTPEDAVMTAHMAAELLNTRWIKLEVIGCPNTLFPDAVGTLQAAKELVGEGFHVLPYCTDDPVLCERLADIGCTAVMPLASPIGSGRGIANPKRMEIIRRNLQCPMIIDAGLGTSSDAAQAMELGADAVLVNTAIAGAADPIAMARAMRLAVEAGRLAFKAGRIPERLYAHASSPMEGRINQPRQGGAAWP